MTNPLSRDRRIVTLLEDAICTKILTWMLAGLDTSAEQVAILRAVSDVEGGPPLPGASDAAALHMTGAVSITLRVQPGGRC
jgi:hypothetical protein